MLLTLACMIVACVQVRPATSLEGHTDTVTCVAYSPDGKVIASGSKDKTIHLWDVVAGKVKFTLQGHSKMVTSVAFSADGKLLASAADDWLVKLWHVATGKETATLKGHTEDVRAVAFSPDGKTLASWCGLHDQALGCGHR